VTDSAKSYTREPRYSFHYFSSITIIDDSFDRIPIDKIPNPSALSLFMRETELRKCILLYSLTILVATVLGEVFFFI